MNNEVETLNFTYRRSLRARYLRITISPERTVTVTVPRRVSLTQARDFVASRRAWIQKHLKRLQAAEERRPPAPDLSHIDLQQAQQDLFARLDALSRRCDLPYSRAAFRCQKTRWGSCSSRNNISLNVNLVFLPAHLQDYVLLHELCHVRHKNHGPAFWDLLDACCGTPAKPLAKELKAYTMPLQR